MIDIDYNGNIYELMEQYEGILECDNPEEVNGWESCQKYPKIIIKGQKIKDGLNEKFKKSQQLNLRNIYNTWLHDNGEIDYMELSVKDPILEELVQDSIDLVTEIKDLDMLIVIEDYGDIDIGALIKNGKVKILDAKQANKELISRLKE